uniref:Uncharacterized protein n=1 Tax=Anguilla anguilla TaxID=7936 RepID=A0A0E9Q0M2_ANGAN
MRPNSRSEAAMCSSSLVESSTTLRMWARETCSWSSPLALTMSSKHWTMNIYFQSTADFILAQLFLKKQEEFHKIPTFKQDQDTNLP